MPEEFDFYADKEITTEDLRNALSDGLKPLKRKEEQVEYLVEILVDLMSEAEYPTILRAIKEHQV